MIGTWRWNAIAGAAMSLIILLVSYPRNPIPTSIFRAAVCFAVVFAVTFVIRWLIGQAVSEIRADDANGSAPPSESSKGQNIDFVTPDDSGNQADFAPLEPPRLASMGSSIDAERNDPEQLARAIRHLANSEPSKTEG